MNEVLSQVGKDSVHWTCIFCGKSEKGMPMWPHKNEHGMIVGFVFICESCLGYSGGLTLLVRGLKERERHLHTVVFTYEQVKAYLDGAIRNWRKKREKEPEKKEMASHYVDAFQSVRVSLFGELLPPEEKESDPQPRAAFRLPDEWAPVGSAIEDIGSGHYVQVNFVRGQVRKSR